MLALREDENGRILLPIKAVPGSSRSEIAGVIGDHLKVRVSAPPEGGRANRAIVKLLAERLRIRPSDIEIVRGRAAPGKVLAIIGIEADDARRLLLD